MKRLLLIAAILLAASNSFAQAASEAPEFNTNRDFRNRVFEVHNRSANDIASAIKLLGSGFKGAGFSVNNDLRTITVRDFPENIVAIEDAIKRLDQPAAVSPEADVQLWILIGAKSSFGGASGGAPMDHPRLLDVPEELAPVVKELRSTLQYSHFAMLASIVHRAKDGSFIENSGLAQPVVLGLYTHDGDDMPYTYRMQHPTISAERRVLTMDAFQFGIKLPFRFSNGVKYQDVGFSTPVTIRENEKVVVGTTTIRDKALIVVMTMNLR